MTKTQIENLEHNLKILKNGIKSEFNNILIKDIENKLKSKGK